MGAQKTHDEFLLDVYKLVYDEYAIVGRYTKSSKKIRFEHIVCGESFEMTPNNFLRGQRCPKCAYIVRSDKKRKPLNVFLKEIKLCGNGEYDVLGEYKNNRTPIEFLHCTCGNHFNMAPDNFIIAGQRCPKCSYKKAGDKQRKSQEEFLEEVFELVGNEYSVVGKYFQAQSKVEFIHNVCGTSFEITPDNFLRGKRCRFCSLKNHESKLVRQLKDYYKENYNALEEYKIPNLENNYKYDIYIPQYEMYIEVHGQQHYEFVPFWHKTKENFKDAKNRDRTKKKYAKKYGVFVEIDIRKHDFNSAVSFIEDIIYMEIKT